MAEVTDLPTSRLRIAVLNRNFTPTAGGAERYAIALVEQLAARHEIHVFAQNIEHKWPGVTYHTVSMPLRKPRWINQLWYATATWRATRHADASGQAFDVVHSHENTWHGNVQTVHVLPVWHNLFRKVAGNTGAVKRALRWLKVVTSPRLLTYLTLESKRFTLPEASTRRIMVTSPSLHAVMAATFPKAKQAVTTLVPGVDLPQRVPTPDEKKDARSRLGLGRDGACLLFVGNDFEKKGLRTAIFALSALISRATLTDPVTLMVVGKDARQSDFQALADDLGVGARLVFMGAKPDVSPYYRAADVLVHPTREDTFAMVVLEAMAHGVPVVVSGPAYCGIAELLQDGVDSIVLPQPDSKALTHALTRLLQTPSLRATLSVQARTFAEQHAWPDKARAQEAVYRTVSVGVR
jgi:glycosyltransferase involved in cell wall biosynthesis